AGRPLVPVTLVHAVVLPDLGTADVRMREQEFADGGIEREAVHALAGRVDQHCARPIQDVAGGDLRAPGLQAIVERARTAPRLAAMNRKERADGDVDADVARAVER